MVVYLAIYQAAKSLASYRAIQNNPARSTFISRATKWSASLLIVLMLISFGLIFKA
jgi:uncharacterized membrane protein